MNGKAWTWFRGALVGLAIGGCDSSADMASEASGGWTPKTSSDASADAGASYGGGWQDGSAGAPNTPVPGSGGQASDNESGIGLKPGGAQDINYFRMLVEQGKVPKPGDMTIEGWLNEHDTKLPKAQKDRLVSLHALAAVLEPKGATGPEAMLQLGLNSAKSLQDVTASVALTVVVDRSGSMHGDKMASVKAGLKKLVEVLPSGTRLALVSFSSGATTDFAPKTIGDGDKAAVLQAIDKLVPQGGTNLHDGLKLGREHCQAAGQDFTFRRVIFLSDGQATEGNTSKSAILDQASQAAAGGCSVSTVGVGMDYDHALMVAIAQKANGTAWFAKDSAQAETVFTQDLETLLLPVAEKLWMSFQLAQGWKVAEIYGFDWVEKDGKVVITGPKKPTTAEPQPTPGADAGSTTPPPPPDDVVALPTLHASKKNGLILVRLQAPAGLEGAQILDLTLAQVSYGYTIAKEQKEEKFTVPVQVAGLTPIADGGLAYFADPIVRRAWTLLRTGLDLQAACTEAEAGQKVAATQRLDLAVERIVQQKQALGTDLAVIDASQPDLNDADKLVKALRGLIAK